MFASDNTEMREFWLTQDLEEIGLLENKFAKPLFMKKKNLI
jgi:hypothetical protein